MERKCHLVYWNHVCQRKEKGGLDIKKLNLLNKVCWFNGFRGFLWKKVQYGEKYIRVKYDIQGGWFSRHPKGSYGVGLDMVKWVCGTQGSQKPFQ